MNRKKPYHSPIEQAPIEREVDFNGKTLSEGMVISVWGTAGRPQGKYIFEYAQDDAHGTRNFYVYGPLRRRVRHHRIIRPYAVRAILASTKRTDHHDL